MVLLNIIESLKGIDTQILLWINGNHTDTLDTVMWNASGQFQWVPLYLIFAYFIIQKYGKQSWLPIVTVIFTIVIADQASNHLVKDVVMRYRPSHNLLIKDRLHFVNDYTGGLYGFASSHAANTSAFALFMILLFRKWLVAIPMCLWVLLVCYSRMYLGVHYPSDIIGGMIIGMLDAYIMFRISQAIQEKLPKPRADL